MLLMEKMMNRALVTPSLKIDDITENTFCLSANTKNQNHWSWLYAEICSHVSC